MTICKNCDNILTKHTDVNGLRFKCSSCGSEYKSAPIDSRISHSSITEKIQRPKNGRTIFCYAANPKIATPCPKCKATITAWELDSNMQKIFGCNCSYSWMEIRIG